MQPQQLKTDGNKMKTIRTKVYDFSELNESAKERAVSNFLNSERDFFWMDEYLQTIKNALDFYGFELGYRWQFDYGSANRSYMPVVSCHSHNIEELTGVRLWKYIQKNYFTYRCKYSNKVKQTIEGDCPFTGFCADEDFLQPLKEFMKKPTNINFQELMEDCVYSTLKAAESEHDYQNSEEFAIEQLTERETMYTKDGEIFMY